MEARIGEPAKSLSQLPAAFAPFVGLAGRHDLGQIHARETGKRARFRKRALDVDFTRHQAAALRALLTQEASELARVDVRDRGDAVRYEVLAERPAGAPVREKRRNVAHHQPGGVHARGFLVLGVDAGVADMRVRERDDLAAVGGIREDFLVAGHRGVEDDLSGGAAARAGRAAAEHRPVGEDEEGGLERGHGLLHSGGRRKKAGGTRASPARLEKKLYASCALLYSRRYALSSTRRAFRSAVATAMVLFSHSR